MSTATAESESPQELFREPIPNRSDTTKVIRTWALEKIAHTGMMLGKIIREIRYAEKLQKFAATGDPNVLEFTPEEEAEMAVNIGNENHYHMQETHPQVAAAANVDPIIVKPEIVKPEIVQPVVAPVANGNGKSGLLPIVAAILGTVGIAGIGAGALAIWDRVQHKPVPEVTNIQNPLQDWELGIQVTDTP